jgi:hypothetical protein
MQALAHMTRAHVAKPFAAWVEATRMSGFYRCATAGPVLRCSSYIPYILPLLGMLSKFEEFLWVQKRDPHRPMSKCTGWTPVDLVVP